MHTKIIMEYFQTILLIDWILMDLATITINCAQL